MTEMPLVMNECRTMDFMPDQMYNGKRFGALTGLDLFSRACWGNRSRSLDAGESVKSCRDEAGNHCVPKRTLGELIIKRYSK